MRPKDAATQKLLEDPDDTLIYVNEIIKTRKGEQNDETSGSLLPKTRG